MAEKTNFRNWREAARWLDKHFPEQYGAPEEKARLAEELKEAEKRTAPKPENSSD